MVKGSTLGKDPSIEWFFNDWHGGTAILSRHQKGCFMDLLHGQFNNGHLSIEAIKNILGNDFAIWGVLSKKFVQDERGLYYNARLELQMIKKFEYNKSRRNNYDGISDERMGNGNGDGSLDLLKRKEGFVYDVSLFFEYSEEMRKDFSDYWTEHGKNDRKMRFEKEKSFDISKRLARWSKNNKSKNGVNQASPTDTLRAW